MRRLFLAACLLAALVFAFAPLVARAQSIPCATQPVPTFNILTDSTFLVERGVSQKAGVCRGVATRVTSTRYRILHVPCAVGEPWRDGGDSTTMAKALRGAGKPPACAPIIVPPPPPPPVDTTPVPPPPPPPPVGTVRPQLLDQSWGVCPTGQTCAFSGLRDVRLIGANGSSLVQNVRGVKWIDCAGYAFPNGYNIGALSRCEYSPVKTVEITNPVPGMHGFGATFRVPQGDNGTTAALSGSAGGFNGTRVQDGLGATRMKCELFKFAYDDPILFPGQPGKAHLHMLFGNARQDYFNLTSANIRGPGVSSTCQGGTLNASAYWVPALYDTLTHEVILPRFGQFYYKSGYGVDITATREIPSGLVMIAGDKNGTPANPSRAGAWLCGQAFESNVIPDCTPGRPYLEMAVSFPSCWNGRDLDSPDHISHMAYPSQQSLNRWGCPASHPVLLPKIDLLFDFDLTPNSHPERWRLSSDMYVGGRGGASLHADYMIGWEPNAMKTLVTQCLNKGLDCGVGVIGNNTALLFR